ncbi:MAG: hypothetical protein A3I61_00600 [Acidobacteria bacterium RIFCSPLOWO2_02_FULL_68_18]|nr:MAG: hypothetical protein A3I61_00600 [Acidobacteria bacterium RIFCSPLOWO2_02_FULL_68_18]OFW49405.1 MAG: hypothetical protein A3G77_01970 [Acidobacteria bacterium RIFCSPLOWO2_12_FULL_68_19]
MKPAELQQILGEFAAERLALVARHEAGARAVSHYDFNNAYQYVINREETQLGWLRSALDEYGAPLPPASAAMAVPNVPKLGRQVAPSAFRAVLEDDARLLAAFVERWNPRVESMTHARHRLMLGVILGESREHQRTFEQAAAGIEDLLGRRTGGVPRQGSVLPVRWME